jgi:Raf kinase inhibitor-like YbhB/YbcL family protein
MPLTIRSPAFTDGGELPTPYTCEGPNRSPPLSFAGVPPGARSLALVVDDPDAPDPAAPKTVFVHWVLHDLPPDAAGLAEGVRPEDLPRGTQGAANDYGKTGWKGPCPPIGRHRYFFKLYALDAVLGPIADRTKVGLLAAMKGHVLEEAQLVGTYQKRKG